MSSKFPDPNEDLRVPKDKVPTFSLKTGDSGPPLTVRFADEDNNPVAIDPNTDTVEFRMEDDEQNPVSLSNQAQIDDGPEGVVSYPWATSDTEDPGTYFGEFVVTFNEGESDERTETFPNAGFITISIGRDVATP